MRVRVSIEEVEEVEHRRLRLFDGDTGSTRHRCPVNRGSRSAID